VCVQTRGIKDLDLVQPLSGRTSYRTFVVSNKMKGKSESHVCENRLHNIDIFVVPEGCQVFVSLFIYKTQQTLLLLEGIFLDSGVLQECFFLFLPNPVLLNSSVGFGRDHALHHDLDQQQPVLQYCDEPEPVDITKVRAVEVDRMPC